MCSNCSSFVVEGKRSEMKLAEKKVYLPYPQAVTFTTRSVAAFEIGEPRVRCASKIYFVGC